MLGAAKARDRRDVNRSFLSTQHSVLSTALALEFVQIIDVDGAHVAEKHHQDRQADCRLGGRDGKNEKHEYLSGRILQEMREGDEIDVHRQQHQLDRHQQDDYVLAVQKNSHHAYREQDCAENEVVREG